MLRLTENIVLVDGYRWGINPSLDTSDPIVQERIRVDFWKGHNPSAVVTPIIGDETTPDETAYEAWSRCLAVGADDAGNPVSIPEPRPVEEVREHVMDALRAANHAHIYQHFDPPAQITLTATAADAMDLGASLTKDMCRTAKAWINSSLTHYYERKGAIMAATTLAELETAATWDFGTAAPLTTDVPALQDVITIFSAELAQ
jgi:hypothetical protein